MASNFKVFLSFAKQPTAELVYQKQDGQRFSACNTVKLNMNTTYTVSVVIRPQRQLNGLLVQGERLEIYPTKPDRDDDDSCKFQANWTTIGFAQCTSGKRKEVPFVFEMDKGVTMKVTLQCKFYPEGETQHCNWGQPLHSIEYTCLVPEVSSYVEVTSTKYI